MPRTTSPAACSGVMPLVSLAEGIRELVTGYTMIRNSRYGNV